MYYHTFPNTPLLKKTMIVIKIIPLIAMISFLVIQHSHGKLHPIELREISSKTSLNQCILELCKQYFPPRITTINFSFTFYSNYSSAFSLTQVIISNIMHSNHWTTLVHNVESNIEFHLNPMVIGYVIQMKRYTDLATVVGRIISRDRFANFIVIFEEVTQTTNAEASQIIKILKEEKVISAMVILPDHRDWTNFKIYQWSPPCGVYREYIPQECSFGSIRNTKRNSSKTTKCVVKARYVRWPPYVVDPNTNEGIDVKLLNTVAAVLDLDIEYKEAIHKIWATIKNGRVIGDFKLLDNGSIDLVIGGYSMTTADRLKFFDSSPAYMMEKLTWCAPHEILVENLANIINVFDTATWIALFLFYFGITCSVWYLSQRTTQETTYRSFKNCLLYNFAILIGISTHALPRTSKIRYLMVLFIILSFIMTLIYSSYLTSVISSPGRKEKYSTVKDIDKGNLRFYALDHSTKFFKNLVNDVHVMSLIERRENCTDAIRCLELVSDRKDSAVCLSQMHKNYLFKYKFPKKSAVYCLEEAYLTFSINVIMRKGFSFLEPINEVIRRVISSGFVAKWRNDLTFDSHISLGNSAQDSMVTLSDLKPILLVLCWCYGLAMVAFLLEIIVHNAKKLK